jgi:hypothetical protein
VTAKTEVLLEDFWRNNVCIETLTLQWWGAVEIDFPA